jgi:DNA polymerase
MSEDDMVGELATLARQLRGQLARHAAAGTWAAPGAATARPSAMPEVPEVPEVPDVPALLEAVEPFAADARTSRRSLPQIREELGECTRCKLHTTRRSIVFGVGDPSAPLMFVGEAPGEQEDKRGEPFVGPAGELLDKMIDAMGWTREAVYIANTVKCRPPGNRNPEADELAACKPFLDAQLAAVAPRIIVALGRPAANQLLENNAPISTLRGRFHERRGVRVMPTFHPAYLLRTPEKKREAWDDLKLVMAELARIGVVAPKAR